MKFSEIMIATYDTNKNITAAVMFEVSESFFSSAIDNPEPTLLTQHDSTKNCTPIYASNGIDVTCAVNY